MPTAIDGTPVPSSKPPMACGGTPKWHYESGCAYFCDTCMAVIGSVSQPQRCVEKNKTTGEKDYD